MQQQHFQIWLWLRFAGAGQVITILQRQTFLGPTKFAQHPASCCPVPGAAAQSF